MNWKSDTVGEKDSGSTRIDAAGIIVKINTRVKMIPAAKQSYHFLWTAYLIARTLGMDYFLWWIQLAIKKHGKRYFMNSTAAPTIIVITFGKVI